MRTADLDREEVKVCLISGNSELQSRLELATNHWNLLSGISLFIESKFPLPSSMGYRVILIDIVHPEASGQKFVSWIDAVRAYDYSVVFIGLYDVSNSATPARLIHEDGFDLVLPASQETLVVANIAGVARCTQAINDRRQLRSVHSVQGEKIGDWVLVSRHRSVRLPNGTLSRLTENEWSYLEYLVSRDLRGIEIPEHVDKKIKENSRQNTIVYNIKKKLGEDFPIVSAGGGQYKIDI